MTIAFVTSSAKSNNINSASTAGPVTVASGVNPTVKDLVFVSVSWVSASAVTASTVSDTKSNAWTKIGGFFDVSDNTRMEFWISTITSGGAADTFQAAFGANVGFPEIIVGEYSNATGIWAPIAYNAGKGTAGGTASSGNVTSSTGNNVFISTNAQDNQTLAGEAGWAVRILNTVNTFGDLYEDRIVTSQTTAAGTSTGNFTNWAQQVMVIAESIVLDDGPPPLWMPEDAILYVFLSGDDFPQQAPTVPLIDDTAPSILVPQDTPPPLSIPRDDDVQAGLFTTPFDDANGRVVPPPEPDQAQRYPQPEEIASLPLDGEPAPVLRPPFDGPPYPTPVEDFFTGQIVVEDVAPTLNPPFDAPPYPIPIEDFFTGQIVVEDVAPTLKPPFDAPAYPVPIEDFFTGQIVVEDVAPRLDPPFDAPPYPVPIEDFFSGQIMPDDGFSLRAQDEPANPRITASGEDFQGSLPLDETGLTLRAPIDDLRLSPVASDDLPITPASALDDSALPPRPTFDPDPPVPAPVGEDTTVQVFDETGRGAPVVFDPPQWIGPPPVEELARQIGYEEAGLALNVTPETYTVVYVVTELPPTPVGTVIDDGLILTPQDTWVQPPPYPPQDEPLPSEGGIVFPPVLPPPAAPAPSGSVFGVGPSADFDEWWRAYSWLRRESTAEPVDPAIAELESALSKGGPDTAELEEIEDDGESAAIELARSLAERAAWGTGGLSSPAGGPLGVRGETARPQESTAEPAPPLSKGPDSVSAKAEPTGARAKSGSARLGKTEARPVGTAEPDPARAGSFFPAPLPSAHSIGAPKTLSKGLPSGVWVGLAVAGAAVGLAAILGELEPLPRGRKRPEFPPWATPNERWVRCGKKDCNVCPHGPYIYMVWRDERDSSRMRSVYVGKKRSR